MKKKQWAFFKNSQVHIKAFFLVLQMRNSRRLRLKAVSLLPRDVQFYGSCCYCKRHRRLTLDHIHPICRGGSSHISNLAWCCSPCNRLKSSKTLSTWINTLSMNCPMLQTTSYDFPQKQQRVHQPFFSKKKRHKPVFNAQARSLL